MKMRSLKFKDKMHQQNLRMKVGSSKLRDENGVSKTLG
jgi:hypothetical protein